MRDGKVGFAVVGCGVIGPFHTQCIDTCGKAAIVALCDIEKDKADELAAEHGGGIATYADYREMLDTEGDIDVVCVCTPSGHHWEVTVAAAQRGRHVLSEKPLDVTSAHMDAMIDACRTAGVKLGCIFQRRTYASSRKVKQFLDDGRLGRLVLVDSHQKYYRSPAYYQSAGWRGTWELDGGGALMNQAVHGIDLTQYLVGDVESVFAYAAPLVRHIEVEDTCVAVLKFANGAMGTLTGTTSVTPGFACRHEIHGEDGTIHLTDYGIEKVFLADERAGKAEEIDPAEYADGGPDTDMASTSDPRNIPSFGHAVQIEDMAEAVLTAREPMIPGTEARKAVEVILAIYESARTGREVRLTPRA